MGEAPFVVDPELPRAFGDYVLLELLAQGGMGDVYLAKTAGGPMGIERACVVKALRPELTRDPSYVTRFVDEARLVVKLQHPNICHVFDVGKFDEQYYVAMEYIEGWTLGAVVAQLVEQRLPTPGDVFIHIVAETLAALDYAHQLADESGRPLELVHRDVSLHNVMVDAFGSVKLVDFGIASSRMKVERTAPEVVLGKLAYMSPEQARGQDVDGRSDLFATAVMLYEMIAGERYYQGLSTEQIWQVVGRGGFRPRLWNAVPTDLRAVLARALATELSERFATAGEFEDELRRLLIERGKVIGPPQVRDLLAQIDAEEEDHTEILETSVAEYTQSGVAAPQTSAVHFAQSDATRTAARVSSAALPQMAPDDPATDKLPAGASAAASRPLRPSSSAIRLAADGRDAPSPLPDSLASAPTAQFTAPEAAAAVAQPAPLAGPPVAPPTEVIDREDTASAMTAAVTAQMRQQANARRRRLLLVGTLATLLLLGGIVGGALWLKRPKGEAAPKASPDASPAATSGR
jgi:serine/threonine protein kinase